MSLVIAIRFLIGKSQPLREEPGGKIKKYYGAPWCCLGEARVELQDNDVELFDLLLSFAGYLIAGALMNHPKVYEWAYWGMPIDTKKFGKVPMKDITLELVRELEVVVREDMIDPRFLLQARRWVLKHSMEQDAKFFAERVELAKKRVKSVS